jgi:hypothetical protein
MADMYVTNQTCALGNVSVEEVLYNINLLIKVLEMANASALESITGDGISKEEAADADDAIWILSSTTIIFTMQSGKRNKSRKSM